MKAVMALLHAIKFVWTEFRGFLAAIFIREIREASMQTVEAYTIAADASRERFLAEVRFQQEVAALAALQTTTPPLEPKDRLLSSGVDEAP